MKSTVQRQTGRRPKFGGLPTRTVPPGTASGRPREEMFHKMDASSCSRPTGKTSWEKHPKATNTVPMFLLSSCDEKVACQASRPLALPDNRDGFQRAPTMLPYRKLT